MYLKTVSKKIVIAGTLLIWMIKFIVRPFVHVPIGIETFGWDLRRTSSVLFYFLLVACWFFQRFFKLQTNADLNLPVASDCCLWSLTNTCNSSPHSGERLII
jgi:hypothetical protein